MITDQYGNTPKKKKQLDELHISYQIDHYQVNFTHICFCIYCSLTVAIFITYSQNSNLPFIISSSPAPRGSKNGATPTFSRAGATRSREKLPVDYKCSLGPNSHKTFRWHLCNLVGSNYGAPKYSDKNNS